MADTNPNREDLSDEAYAVTQNGDTEPAFSGTLLDNKADGMYHCIVCGQALFSSEAKYDSGSGWPSFTDVKDEDSVTLVPDDSRDLERTEVRCASCGAHLGHVFPDGPEPTGKRFCINSSSLNFRPNLSN